ncbi:uncharacterized protein LOC110861197 [Folsomia candida]|uniref:uncharacterized protein LOC110861197 n=1 Tax=Folsomia candida TaxID=158441 RepID=UPI000B8EFFC3|nr:uncharacterized protein LOC110861197 [Folsomia candida]
MDFNLLSRFLFLVSLNVCQARFREELPTRAPRLLSTLSPLNKILCPVPEPLKLSQPTQKALNSNILSALKEQEKLLLRIEANLKTEIRALRNVTLESPVANITAMVPDHPAPVIVGIGNVLPGHLVSNAELIRQGYPQLEQCLIERGTTFASNYRCLIARGRLEWINSNLVIRDEDGRATWSVLTEGEGFRLTFQHDGNLVLYNQENRPFWASYTEGITARLVFQPDRNLVVYGASNNPVWASMSYVKM